jgi:putative acetyltransferase
MRHTRDVMRFPDAVRASADVQQWLDSRRGPLGTIARHWFARLRDGGADVCELMHDGCATACIGDGAFAYVGVYRAHVSIGFFHGTVLPDPGAVLEGAGRFMRHVKLRPGDEDRTRQIEALISAARLDMRQRQHTLRVRPDDLSSPEVQALIAEHLAGMHATTPVGHVHAMAIDALRHPSITLWTVWRGQALCGCGALKHLDATSGEIKSMRTRAAFLRQGVGQAVLDTIIGAARDRGYTQLFLETGSGAAFAAAHALYLRNGFRWCGPFGDYAATDFNVFMTKTIRGA